MSGPGAIVRFRLAVAVSAGELESVTMKTTGVAFAAAFGVPLSNPLEALNAKPPGRLPPAICQVYGPVPPAAARVVEYATPAIPFGSDDVVILNAAVEIVRLKLALAVCAGEPESVTLKVSGVAATTTDGVPEMVPEDASKFNPAGREPAVSCQL